jgi:hypothetical protein
MGVSFIGLRSEGPESGRERERRAWRGHWWERVMEHA